jgi:hypothetical protein
MKYKKLYFSGHATIQMFKRSIQVEHIEFVIKNGKIIKEYPLDKPFPSFLMVGFPDGRPLHVVASTDSQGNCYIITAYEPDPELWSNDFSTKI